MQNKVFIKEMFNSIQGEGPYIGVNQLFIRFSKCNLHCNYCDTEFKSDLKEYTAEELAKAVNEYKNINSVSLTGGEPLCETDFLINFLPLVNKKIYLETNGTLFENLKKVIGYTDIISMDIKLPSCTCLGNLFEAHKFFTEIAVKNHKEIFFKVVFDEKITKEEIVQTISLAKKYNILIILQPKTNSEGLALSSEFINKIYFEFTGNYHNVRLIPQVHKFLNIR